MHYDYRVYGLALRANRRLPHLVVSSAGEPAPDVRFDLGDAGRDTHALRLRFADERGELMFAISLDGRRIWCDWSRAANVATIGDVAALLVGPVLGCTLRLRGELSLHASVVGIGGRAIVLVGSHGSGKSTVAAALAEDHSVLSDDVAAVTREDADWIVHPGYPSVRLEPASLRALGLAFSTLPVVTSGVEKRYVPLASGGGPGRWDFGSDGLKIGGLYVLERQGGAEAPTIESIPGAERLTTLMRHRSGQELMRPDRHHQAKELAGLARLATDVPVRRINFPSSLAHLRLVRDILLDDLAGVC